MQLANGDQSSAELQRLLAETQQNLEQSLQKCDGLEQTIQTNEKNYESECLRLNTEIERLNNILKATNGNM